MEYKKNLIFFALVICFVTFFIQKCGTERVLFMSVERPQVTFFDPEYYSSVFFKSRLASRRDPVHYVSINYTSLKVMDNNFTVSLYFYQLLSNVYKRSFVDIHYKFCDFIEKDEIIGEAFREAYHRVPEKERLLKVLKCPAPPGLYNYPDMRFRLTVLLDSFPFQQGRVYINVTHRGRDTGRGNIDFHIKPLPKTKK